MKEILHRNIEFLSLRYLFERLQKQKHPWNKHPTPPRAGVDFGSVDFGSTRFLRLENPRQIITDQTGEVT